MTTYQLLPPLKDDELAELRADIQARGVMVPVELDDEGNILDGHNRVAICEELSIDYPSVVRYGLSESEKRQHVRKLNLARRHLSQADRRALIAESLKDAPEKSNRQHARELGVSDNTVRTVRDDLESTAQIAQLDRTVGSDGKERPATRPAPVFAPTAKDREQATRPEVVEKISTGAAKDVRQASRQIAREERDERLASAPPLPEGEFDLILADPPWRYEFCEADNREIENHYPTMDLDEICALDVPSADNCVLFLWATSPKLAESMRVVEAWGFTYRTCMVWVKDRIGMGYYARQKHELLLIATKGQPGTPNESDRPPSVIESPRGVHSKKPESSYVLIETMYPNASRLEMFSRLTREGWTSFGNEVSQ